jgi:hypothetical protein
MSDHRRPAGSQRDRLLAWARAGHLIHQDDWYNRGADGGSPIKAVRSRIPELEALGYGFDHTTRPDRTIEYRLAYVPDRPTPRPRSELAAVAEAGDPDEQAVDQLALALGELEPPAPSRAAA